MKDNLYGCPGCGADYPVLAQREMVRCANGCAVPSVDREGAVDRTVALARRRAALEDGYRRGWNGWRLGMNRSDNPWKPNDPEFAGWDIGWLNAQARQGGVNAKASVFA